MRTQIEQAYFFKQNNKQIKFKSRFYERKGNEKSYENGYQKLTKTKRFF